MTHKVIVTPMATITMVPLTTLNTSPKRFTLYICILCFMNNMLYLFCTLMKNWFNLWSSSSSSTNKVNHEISSSSLMNWLYFVKPKKKLVLIRSIVRPSFRSFWSHKKAQKHRIWWNCCISWLYIFTSISTFV